MAFQTLQPEQAAAAYEIDRHVSVTAGPGSGKTTVLVERYLHILKERHLPIDQVVAITFTNRAANEMRERLRERLNTILLSTTEKERQRWLDYKRRLDGAVITTIHGFCARLLREFPVEARIDPQFVLLDEHRASMLLESVVDDTVSKFISAGHVDISRLALGVGRGRLVAALAQLYREVRGQGISLQELALNTAQAHATEQDHARALGDLSHTMNGFLRSRMTTTASIGAQAKVGSFWPTVQELVQSIPDASGLADYCRAFDDLRNVRPRAQGVASSHVKALDELLWEKELLGKVPQLCLDLFASKYALEIVNVLTTIDDRLDEEKQKLSALDFDDLELRALALLDRPEVLTRASERYKFFLVDEFQDTNGLQRRLLERLALSKSGKGNANLFIVGDRKQSIYGFRGADVDVFRDMTATLIETGGEAKPLRLNFRSQPPLISFFNYLFTHLFDTGDEIAAGSGDELGYVEHEPSEAKREIREHGPLVELMVTTTTVADGEDLRAEQNSRELDAEQLALRISTLVQSGDDNPIRYSDIALLFRAMSNVQTYETVFRRWNIPYQTVLGKGFYERPEITDLIQLLRFLDNKTDELALAAVLRSPLCGISDNALLALRCGPWLDSPAGEDPLRYFTQTRKLVYALERHDEISFISDDEHALLDQAANLIKALIERRHHYSIADLLRFAVDGSEYLPVVAANFDGAQRLANVQRLFTLAERFEGSGTHLIRDFVHYVEEFEAIGSRESEGQIDEAANAVRLMTIHQAKGLEFPIVIIPDLQRLSKPMDNWVLLDRHRGLTMKVPDGRGKLVAGRTFKLFEQRHSMREKFESMRLLYVAATRAQDRLILSGTNEDLGSLNTKDDTWLKWIWHSLQMGERSQSGIIKLREGVEIQLTINAAKSAARTSDTIVKEENATGGEAESLSTAFPLLRSVPSEREGALHRFSVTQLINYQRCARQYYFDRVLHAPSADELAVWNDAEAPEPPANLTATLKGAVIHRFCEMYRAGENPGDRVRLSLEDTLRRRQAELADRLLEINPDAAVKELLPLAENYLVSDLFKRIETARQKTNGHSPNPPMDQPGLWSELSFHLRRPLGVVSGAIDKLLMTRQPSGALEVEIVDFKTNRLAKARPPSLMNKGGSSEERRGQRRVSGQQMPLDFMSVSSVATLVDDETTLSLVTLAARDYQLQMQAYALAVRMLLPCVNESTLINVTLHFLEPNVEFRLPEQLMTPEVCSEAIDSTMLQIVSSLQPEHFPAKPFTHCRMCTFLGICKPGRDFVRG